MANDKDQKKISNKKINNILDTLDSQASDLYKLTYHSTNIGDTLYNSVSDELDEVINNSTNKDDEYKDLSNITKLYQKLSDKIGYSSKSNKIISNLGNDTDDDISTLFKSTEMMSSIMDSYAKTKWVTELDNEFDLICKYMPKLQTALDIKKDATLCSDSYNKEFLNINPKNINTDSERNIVIETNINNLKDKYNLEEKLENWYDNTSKYGEEFIYCVPYNLAFKELLKRKDDTRYSVAESVITTDLKVKELSASRKSYAKALNGAIYITFDKSKILKEAINNNYNIRKSMDTTLCGLSQEAAMLSEAGENDTDFDSHIHRSGKTSTEIKFNKTIGDTIEWEDDDKSASQGLYDLSKKSNTNYNTKVMGAVLRTIRHDRFIPIYIEDTFFGGYDIGIDFEKATDPNADSNTIGYNSLSSMFNIGKSQANSSGEEYSGDGILRTISNKISKAIDANFINSNVDLSKEIYLMLKYNDRYNQVNGAVDINITFIPADDIYHFKFKEDPVTHRGVSDLWDSLVSAKQWIMINTTTVLGQTTRGYDRRIYYVKQSLDTNTAQSLLNVVSQIKKGNFGVRQMESVNNILGILGRFNDFVIPTDSGGQPPIVFDTQPGQQFDYPTDLMQNLEESSINPITPIEIVNASTSMDFATRYTMTNAKLLRSVLKRQGIIERIASRLITNLYFFEYGEKVELEVTLPIPAFLSMTQGTQLLQTATQYIDARSELDMAGEDDDAKAIYKKFMIDKLLPGYMSHEDIENIKNKVRINSSINATANAEPSDDDM